jgi:hypothetical protein
MFEVLVTALIGFFGWITAYFCGKPILRLISLREDIHVALIRHANVLPNIPEGQPIHEIWKPEHERAVNDLRSLAAQLTAVQESWWTARTFAYIRGYNIEKAAKSLIGLSNSTGDGATICDHRVRRALRIPTELSDGEFAQMLELRRKGIR